MGYIMDLRAYVGHRPLIQVGSSVIVEDGQGRVLLQRRSDDRSWDCTAAGSMEPGESAEETARRELLEETGLTAGRLELLEVLSGPEQHYIYPNGDEVYNVDFVFSCREWFGEPKRQEDEVEELRFFPRDGLPENLSGHMELRLPGWLRHRRGGELPGVE